MSEPEELPSITGRLEREVQWGECDPAGIIFYPNYFRWFDAGTWALFAAVGWSAKRIKSEGFALPLVSASAEFRHPAEQGDRCELRSRIARFGGKSFVVSHEVARADGTLMATGTETRVWGKFADGPGTPMKGQTIDEAMKTLFRRP